MILDRRRFLAMTGAALMAPRLSFAATPEDRRLVFIVLRGGMDGLAAVPPLGDADYTATRGGLALLSQGAEASALKLDGFFGLHKALAPLHGLYQKGELALVHAVASPYRERSHFDGQDLLESGGAKPHAVNDGWLNRALGAMSGGKPPAMAVSQGISLALRGAVPVTSWAPSPLAGMAPELARKLVALYARDSLFASALDEGLQAEHFVTETLGEDRPAMRKRGGNFPKLAEAAGKLMAAEGGPGVVLLECGGWDTHTHQGTGNGRMAQPLTELGQGIAALAQASGPVWARTVVMAVSEFGRTAAPNGTGGTDHGTAGAMLLAGGAVTGGKVLARWPGLAKDKLHQGRDLAPTTDLRAVFKAVLKDHFGLSSDALNRTVFPDSEPVRPQENLIRA